MFVPTANVALETQWSGVDVIFNVAGSYNGLQQPYFVPTYHSQCTYNITTAVQHSHL